MKLLIAFSALILAHGAFALTEEQNDMEGVYIKECVEKTGVDPAVLVNMKNGNFTTRDEKTQCYTKCMLEKAGILDSAGNLNETVAKAIMVKGENKIKIEATIDECKHLKGDCPCATAFKLYECYYTKNVE